MALAVDSHPQKDKIIAALSIGIPLRQIAATLDPPLHFASLQRYKLAKVRPVQRNAHALAMVLGQDKSITEAELQRLANAATSQALQAKQVVDPYLARIAQHAATIDRNLVNAEADGDGRTVAALVGVDLKGLELDARLTGRLDTSVAGTTTIYVMTPQAAVTIGGSGPVVDVTPEPRAIRTNESDSNE